MDTDKDLEAREAGSITLHLVLRDRYNALSQQAMDTYNRFYDNELYSAAIEGKGNAYANMLIDEALCICGNPFFEPAAWDWDADAIAFLRRFIDCMNGDDGPGSEYVEAFNLHIGN